MKLGKSLLRIVDLSDPEWGPYWTNYKFMKKKLKEYYGEECRTGVTVVDPAQASDPKEITKSSKEIEFFRLLRTELKKTSDFFISAEQIYQIRYQRVRDGYLMLQQKKPTAHDKETWTRLLSACVKFYKDVLMLENFAIMNYCAFSKILKKHDKITGYVTRDAFMGNVMSKQNFTDHPQVLEMIKQSERLFTEIQKLERYVCMYVCNN